MTGRIRVSFAEAGRNYTSQRLYSIAALRVSGIYLRIFSAIIDTE